MNNGSFRCYIGEDLLRLQPVVKIGPQNRPIQPVAHSTGGPMISKPLSSTVLPHVWKSGKILRDSDVYLRIFELISRFPQWGREHGTKNLKKIIFDLNRSSTRILIGFLVPAGHGAPIPTGVC